MSTFSFEYPTDSLGTLTLSSDGESITGLWLEGQKYFAYKVDPDMTPAPDLPVFQAAKAWLDAYFAGTPQPIGALPLAPCGTDFQRKVWDQLALIPYGQLTTYGAIANTLAETSPTGRCSARAVGVAVGKNPISIILPCHRVVGSTGSLTGYAGGIPRKVWLLEHEGVCMDNLRIPTRGTAL